MSTFDTVIEVVERETGHVVRRKRTTRDAVDEIVSAIETNLDLDRFCTRVVQDSTS